MRRSASIPQSPLSAPSTSGGKISMADVARLCGYSRTTVSAVLNGKAGVTARARERILKVVAEQHYRPNAAATMLVGKPSRLIGIVMRDMENPYFTRMFGVLEERLTREGYNILYFNTREDHAREREAVLELCAYPIAGVILAPLARAVGHEHLEQLPLRGIPVILTERLHGFPFGYVDFDDRAAGELAAQLMLKHGHRRLAYLAGPLTSGASEDRWEGFLQGLRGHRPTLTPLRVQTGSSSASGLAAATELLRHAEQRPTGIYCFNDLVATGVYKAAQALGLRIPNELSVIGTDDIETAEVLGPPLTSISYSITVVGEYLAKALLAVVGGRRQAGRVRKTFEPRLIERESTGPCRLRGVRGEER